MYIYFLTDREICETRGTNIPIGLYRQCFNAFIAFPTSYGDKKNLFLDRYWSRLPTKRGYTSCYENDRKFLPGAYHIVILLQDTYLRPLRYIKYNIILLYVYIKYIYAYYIYSCVQYVHDSVIILYQFRNGNAFLLHARNTAARDGIIVIIIIIVSAEYQPRVLIIVFLF